MFSIDAKHTRFRWDESAFRDSRVAAFPNETISETARFQDGASPFSGRSIVLQREAFEALSFARSGTCAICVRAGIVAWFLLKP
jgi:hypothetical protein